MAEYANIYIIKHKDNEIKENSYLISVKNGKEPRTIKDYRYSRKKFNIPFDEIDNYEMELFKKVKFGSGYELKMIEAYYKKELGIVS